MERFVIEKAGFRIDRVIAQTMEEMRIPYPVEVYFDQRGPMAMAVRPGGQAEVHLRLGRRYGRRCPNYRREM